MNERLERKIRKTIDSLPGETILDTYYRLHHEYLKLLDDLETRALATPLLNRLGEMRRNFTAALRPRIMEMIKNEPVENHEFIIGWSIAGLFFNKEAQGDSKRVSEELLKEAIEEAKATLVVVRKRRF